MVNVAVVYQNLMAKVHLIISCIEGGVWDSLSGGMRFREDSHWGCALHREGRRSTPPPSGGMACSKTGGRFGQMLAAQIWCAVCSVEMAALV